MFILTAYCLLVVWLVLNFSGFPPAIQPPVPSFRPGPETSLGNRVLNQIPSTPVREIYLYFNTVAEKTVSPFGEGNLSLRISSPEFLNPVISSGKNECRPSIPNSDGAPNTLKPDIANILLENTIIPVDPTDPGLPFQNREFTNQEGL